MKSRYIFLKTTGYFLFILSIIYILYTSTVYLVCFNAVHQLPENVEQEFLRIKIYGSSATSEGNTISGTFSIIDSNGNEIAVIERSWSGAYLSVEFAQSDFNNKYYIFPTRIYGKNRIIEERKERKNGTTLEKYYDDNGQCMLLGYGSSLKDRRNLYALSLFTNNKYKVPDFGVKNYYTIDLSQCKTNRYYSISCDSKGKLSVIEL